MLGSFGTIAVLLFGRPDAYPVRLWPVIAGQVGSAIIAVSCIQALGSSIASRSIAMAAMIMYMLWTDTIHPPGGNGTL